MPTTVNLTGVNTASGLMLPSSSTRSAEVVQRPVHPAADVQPQRLGRRLVDEDLLGRSGTRQTTIADRGFSAPDLRRGRRRPEPFSPNWVSAGGSPRARRSPRGRTRRRSPASFTTGIFFSCAHRHRLAEVGRDQHVERVRPIEQARVGGLGAAGAGERGEGDRPRQRRSAPRWRACLRAVCAAGWPCRTAPLPCGRAYGRRLRRARWLATRRRWCHHPAIESSPVTATG